MKAHRIKEKARVTMGSLSEKLHLAPDILENTTVVNLYGKEMALIENYQSIIDYTSEHVKLQGKHSKLVVRGSSLRIDRFTKEDCKIYGNIFCVEHINT